METKIVLKFGLIAQQLPCGSFFNCQNLIDSTSNSFHFSCWICITLIFIQRQFESDKKEKSCSGAVVFVKFPNYPEIPKTFALSTQNSRKDGQ